MRTAGGEWGEGAMRGLLTDQMISGQMRGLKINNFEEGGRDTLDLLGQRNRMGRGEGVRIGQKEE